MTLAAANSKDFNTTLTDYLGLASEIYFSMSSELFCELRRDGTFQSNPLTGHLETDLLDDALDVWRAENRTLTDNLAAMWVASYDWNIELRRNLSVGADPGVMWTDRCRGKG